MLHIKATVKALELIDVGHVSRLSHHAKTKFGNDSRGKLNRYRIFDHRGDEHLVLVVFLTNEDVSVMMYQEAIELPSLAMKCKEIWKD